QKREVGGDKIFDVSHINNVRARVRRSTSKNRLRSFPLSSTLRNKPATVSNVCVKWMLRKCLVYLLTSRTVRLSITCYSHKLYQYHTMEIGSTHENIRQKDHLDRRSNRSNR